MANVIVANIQFEHHDQAVGIGERKPRLSWHLQTGIEGWKQAGYEIEIYKPVGELLEQTGPVNSDQSVLVNWPFTPLTSRQVVHLRVRVWGEDETFSQWSDF